MTAEGKKGASFMVKAWKIAVVVVLAVAVAGVIAMKQGGSPAPPAQPTTQATNGLPRLVDLGSTTCIPCKMMAPVLEDLKKEYAGRMQVDFIDVNVTPDAAKPYGIRLRPTQVFFDASGREVDRNEGFLSKEDILAKFKVKGIVFPAAPASASQPASSPVNDAERQEKP